MAQTFPAELKTNSHYQAKVTNPEPGHYHFEVTYPTAYEPFEWYDDAYKGERKLQPEGQIDNIEQELLEEFKQLL
jgi:hypothetical protein